MLMKIENLNDDCVFEIKEWIKKYYSFSASKKSSILMSEREVWFCNNPLSSTLIDYIKSLYSSGYGLKIIARNLDLNYSAIRKLFRLWNIVINSGNNICYEKTKEFRKKKALNDPNNPFRGWLDTQKRTKTKYGVQGYFITKDNRKIWLRSTYEYIFAKWLDRNNIQFSYEDKQFILSTGESYRPDFFLSDNIIVEIKGKYYGNRIYKTVMFKNEFPEYKIIVIDNIMCYTKESYNKELKEWKKLRLMS